MLDEVARLAQGPIAESFADADRNPPVFEPDRHAISVPAELANQFRRPKTASGGASVLPKRSAACPRQAL